MKLLCYLAALLILPACSNYSVDINDNPVYQPPPLLSVPVLGDLQLQQCLSQTIKDRQIRSISEFKALNCNYAGIINLSGIDQFSRIEQLTLKGNQIENADELLKLTHLRYLDLSKNPIKNCRTLDQLGAVIDQFFTDNDQCVD